MRRRVSLFSQYNPHGIFIALEDMGYLLMAVAFLFIAPAIAGGGLLERLTRWLFVAGFVAAIGFLVVLSAIYGSDLEYRFEVAVISVCWVVLIVGGVLLSLVFARARRSAETS